MAAPVAAHFDGTTLPPEDQRIFSGRLDKKVLAASGVQWQSRLAVLTQNMLAFTSINGESRDYWPEESSITLDNLREVFEEADQDKSGYLDAAEVKTCLGRLNMPNSDETVAVLMKQLDPGEGISFELL